MVPIALTAWAGCLLVPPGGPPGPPAVIAAAGAAAVLLGLAVRRPRWRAGLLAALLGLLTGLLVAGLHSAQRAADPLRVAAADGGSASVAGTVDGYPRPVASRFTDPAANSAAGPTADPTAGPGSTSGAAGDGQRWAVTITAHAGRVSGVEWAELDSPVTVYGRGPTWATLLPGQAISVSGRLASPARADLPPTLTSRRDARPESAPPWWYQAAGAVRSTLRDHASALPPDPAGLVPGLVVGDTGGIDDRLDADARTAGLTHLLAVSGSHFALLCGLAVLLLGAAGPRVAALGGLAVVIALVVLVGPEPSVLRAAVMGLVTVVALLSGRRRTGVPALAGAVLLLLLVEPALARSAGFALSVLATGALVLVAPWWVAALHYRGVPRGWAQLLCIPVAAQLATLPVIVAISGSISLVGVLANVLVAPVVAPALLVGMAAALCGPWWPSAAQVLVAVAGWLLDWMATVAHTLARWPVAALPWPATPAGVTVLVMLLLGAVAALRRRRPRHLLLAALVGVLGVLLPVKVVGVGWPPPGWLLVACEVGQGDAMVLSTGDPGTAVVVDTGPDPVVMDACLDRLGVTTVAVLMLTHLHADHVAGLAGALDGRLVGPVLTGPGRDPAGTWHAIESAAHVTGSIVSTPPVGSTYRVGALTLTVLGPTGEFHGTESDPNNDSLVVRAEMDGRRMLFTGDIEPPAQQALLRSPEALRADVLKIPHHGSARTLDRFLRAVDADIAVIGVGLDNDYGHPSPKLLAALASAGTGTVLRTDLHGDAAVVVDPAGGGLGTRVRGPDGVITTVSVRE
ncbi:ComEC/Rec2 family competence protein [Nakamurella flava]|uniref:ComEC/Rec2 family competence protein n=1 Tax=Nakamurella flava TaxID=2576308 RepID=UPI00140E468A|nr:ComEC/Rec2 family competence protein [Nakamurella flava]